MPVYLPMQLKPQPGKSPLQVNESVVTGFFCWSKTETSVEKPVSLICGWIWYPVIGPPQAKTYWTCVLSSPGCG